MHRTQDHEIPARPRAPGGEASAQRWRVVGIARGWRFVDRVDRIEHRRRSPTYGFLVYRITNPNPYNDRLGPRFGPERAGPDAVNRSPDRTYNILFIIAVRNGDVDRRSTPASGFDGEVPR